MSRQTAYDSCEDLDAADLRRRGLVSDLARRLALCGEYELRVVDVLLVELEIKRDLEQESGR